MSGKSGRDAMRCVAAAMVALLIWFSAAPCRAVVVYIKGQERPVVGFLKERTDQRVVLDELLPDGRRRERLLVASQIVDVIETVDPRRLERLQPDDPDAYRDYAEELAGNKLDPEAIETARRLYVIAAYLDPEGLGRSALLGLAALAPTPHEQARCRAMAYLLDPRHDDQSLVAPDWLVRGVQPVDPEAAAGLLRAVRLLRRERKAQARAEIEKAEVAQALEQFPELVTVQEFREACQGPGLRDDLLRRLVLLELALVPKSGVVGEGSVGEGGSWFSAFRRGGGAPVAALRFDTLTEFDPRACCFRDGKWVTPEAAGPTR